MGGEDTTKKDSKNESKSNTIFCAWATQNQTWTQFWLTFKFENKNWASKFNFKIRAITDLYRNEFRKNMINISFTWRFIGPKENHKTTMIM